MPFVPLSPPSFILIPPRILPPSLVSDRLVFSRPAQAGELPGPHLFRPGYTYLDAASAPGAPHCNELRGYRAAYSHFIFGTTAWDFWARDQTPVAYRYIGLTDPSAILETGDEVNIRMSLVSSLF